MDRTLRQDYLDAAKTLRGVTNMAMGFLDKVLGAGLISIHNEMTQSLIQQQLKQINWTMTKIAHPDQAEMFRDG